MVEVEEAGARDHANDDDDGCERPDEDPHQPMMLVPSAWPALPARACLRLLAGQVLGTVKVLGICVGHAQVPPLVARSTAPRLAFDSCINSQPHFKHGQ